MFFRSRQVVESGNWWLSCAIMLAPITTSFWRHLRLIDGFNYLCLYIPSPKNEMMVPSNSLICSGRGGSTMTRHQRKVECISVWRGYTQCFQDQQQTCMMVYTCIARIQWYKYYIYIYIYIYTYYREQNVLIYVLVYYNTCIHVFCIIALCVYVHSCACAYETL